MRRFLGLVTLAVLLAACGGTDWNSASGPGGASKAKAPSAVPTKPFVASSAERPYVDALVASTLAKDTWTGVNAATTRCIATAVVHVYGTKAFGAAGLSPNALRGPDMSLDNLADPDETQVTALGAALQACRFGAPIAVQLLRELGITGATQVTCLAHAIETDVEARRFLVVATLDRDVDLGAAHAFVAVMARCVDLPTLVVNAMHVQVDGQTRTCLLTQLRGSQAALEDFMALHISGGDQETASQSQGAIAVAINRCRPSARTGFTVPSG